MEIDYLTDPVEDYRKAIDEARDPIELRQAIFPYKAIASDAYEAAKRISFIHTEEYNWLEFKLGLIKERQKIFAGEPWAVKYGDILMPVVMFEVAGIALVFGTPWGTAFIRMKEEGTIKQKGSIYYLDYPDD